MERAKFLYAEVRVYPASVKMEPYSDKPEWDTLVIAKEPVLSICENIGLVWDSYGNELYKAIKHRVREEVEKKGMELVYQQCPEAPEE